MDNLSMPNPAGVFEIFKQICSIPHGSWNTKALSDFCVEFARNHHCRYAQDDANNVVIFVEASKGKKNSETVILQGHMDMVCDKTKDCPLDMEKDGLELCTDGEYLWAKGTTLGADDGIAVAYMLALVKDKSIAHPPLELLFTADEEVGMCGAKAFDASILNGKRVINLDSEQEGVLTVSCAGGMRATCKLPVVKKEATGCCFTISMNGLRGGHSGIEINSGRTSAIKLLVTMLNALYQESKFELSDISGGKKDNTIPNEASVVICMENSEKENFLTAAEHFAAMVKKDKINSDPNLNISIREIPLPKYSMDEHSTQKLLFALLQAPDGVQAMNPDIPNMVQTSLNLGILQTAGESVVMNFLLRSNAALGQQAVVMKLKSFIKYLGGSIDLKSDYPAWEYRPFSRLVDTMTEIYTELFGNTPVVTSIHAGLECGILAGKIKDMDGVSFGPNIYHAHTPQEKLDIASARRCWEYLLKILEQI